MREELTDDRPRDDTWQRDVIARYCADAEERIRTAGSKSEAARILGELCEHFDRACESSLVRTFLKNHVAHLLTLHWGERV
jgi:hypothetical protein